MGSFSALRERIARAEHEAKQCGYMIPVQPPAYHRCERQKGHDGLHSATVQTSPFAPPVALNVGDQSPWSVGYWLGEIGRCRFMMPLGDGCFWRCEKDAEHGGYHAGDCYAGVQRPGSASLP